MVVFIEIVYETFPINILIYQCLICEGIPELNLVPLDPLYIPRLEMKEGNGNFKFHQTLSNLTIYGLRNFEIKNIT